MPPQGGNAPKVHILHELLLLFTRSSCLTLYNPMDCSLPAPLSMGLSQARILERVAMPSSRGSSNPGMEPVSPALAGGFFTV